MNPRFPILVVAVLAGCAGPASLIPQQSTVMQTRDRLGAPTDIRFDRNGDELWEYARGPMGAETWLVRVGPGGVVRETVQLITLERFSRIAVGKSTKPEVRDLLGRPGDVSFFSGEAVREWRMMDSPRSGRFIVRFTADGIVKEAMMLLDPGEGGGERGSRGGGGRGGRD